MHVCGYVRALIENMKQCVGRRRVSTNMHTHGRVNSLHAFVAANPFVRFNMQTCLNFDPNQTNCGHLWSTIMSFLKATLGHMRHTYLENLDRQKYITTTTQAKRDNTTTLLRPCTPALTIRPGTPKPHSNLNKAQ